MIRSLQHVGLTVPDVEAGRLFYTRFGLEARESGESVVLRCAGRAQDQIRLIPGKRKKLAYVSFGTARGELPMLQRRLESFGVRLIDAPDKEAGAGIWFRDPDGDLINITAAESSPQTRLPVLLNNAGDYRRAAQRGAPHRNLLVQPRRLGHLIKFSLDVPRTIDFYTGVLGMKLSDRIQDVIGFLRCGNDGDHHVLGIAHSLGTGLHHLSFEVGNLDEIALGAEQMIGHGYMNAWGIGRHIYGSNYFAYIRDPWMSMVEYFWDIDYIPEGAHWEPENAELGPQALCQWSTTPPPDDFVTNYELA